MTAEENPQITQDPQKTAPLEPQEQVCQEQQRRGQYAVNEENTQPPGRGQYVTGQDNTESPDEIESIESEKTIQKI